MSAVGHGALARFQDAFAVALFEPGKAAGDGAVAALVAQPGFSVYRNTVLKGCIDALQANYPAVERLVGEEWFRAAAAVYARAKRPAVPMLQDYGDDFPEFLATFEPAAELDFLPAVATLDRAWMQSHCAPDEPPLAAAALAARDPATLAGCTLRPHASARWAFFETVRAVTIWRRNRYDEAPDLGDLTHGAEGAVIVRAQAEVTTLDLDAAGCAFLDACGAGETLARAAARSLECDPHCDLAALMESLLGAGVFAELSHSPLSDRTAP